MDNIKGIEKLAGVLEGRMGEHSKPEMVLDFGTIQSDYSLLTKLFGIPIPKSDYRVCRSLTGAVLGGLLTSVSGGTHDAHVLGSGYHSHDVPTPEKLRRLKPGDTVLVAWVGTDAVVVDIVLQAKEVF